MEERTCIITFKDKKIIYATYSGLEDKKLLDNVKNAFNMVEQYKGKIFLSLVNWSNTNITQEVMDYLKSDEVIQISKNQKKMAMVGITGVKKIFLNIYSKLTSSNTKAFNTEEEAKEWLIQD